MLLKYSIPYVLLLMLSPACSFAAENTPLSNPWMPTNIVQKNGTLRPEKVLEWHSNSKSLPSDWLKIDNKYFSASYPSCIKANGIREESYTPKISEAIDFIPSGCPGYEKSHVTVGLGIGRDEQEKGVINARNYNDPTLLVQDLTINGQHARMFVSAYAVGPEPKSNIQMRWTILTMCGEKTMYIVSSSEPGQPTVDLIDKKSYEFPEFFRKIVETFRCK